MNIFTLHKLSFKFLVYSLYCVLCHSVAVLFYAITSHIESSALLTLKFAPFLEHSIMSLTITIIGGLLIEITLLQIQ